MPIDLNRTAIDPADLAVRSMLEKLPCNILKSHGRDFAAHILLQFKATASIQTAKDRIRAFAERYATSAQAQLEQSQAFAQSGTPGGLVGGFLLSAAGYKRLGFDLERFKDESDTFKDGMKHKDSSLVGGILRTNNKDPEPEDWEAPYRQTIHALAFLADDDEAAVRSAVDRVKADLSVVAVVLSTEHGLVLRNQQPSAVGKDDPARKGQPIEHFGYVDGRSNPLFYARDLEKEAGGTDQWDPSAPLKLVLVPDPFASTDDSFGSYVVFRKLEQDVAAFDAAVGRLAGLLGTNPDLTGAFVVGRFKDGTPVVLQNAPGAGDANNFNYKTRDPEGDRCPRHAHMRKANPRGTTPFTSLQHERERRIVRRGIPYGRRGDPPPVGLLFLCYQADIHLQFEFIQRTWVDNPNFPSALVVHDTGDDPLVGQDARNANQNWPTRWGESKRRRSDFGGHVTLKGGEYFFAPSLSFLKSL